MWTLVSASDEDRQALANAGLFRFAQKAPEPRSFVDLPAELQLVGEAVVESRSRSVSPDDTADSTGVLEWIVALDVAFADASHSAGPPPAMLKRHRPEPEIVDAESETDSKLEMPKFDEELLLKMLANLAADRMTLEDLAG